MYRKWSSKLLLKSIIWTTSVKDKLGKDAAMIVTLTSIRTTLRPTGTRRGPEVEEVVVVRTEWQSRDESQVRVKGVSNEWKKRAEW